MDGCEGGKPCLRISMSVGAAAVSACICALTTCFTVMWVGSNKCKSNICSTWSSGWMFSADLSV